MDYNKIIGANIRYERKLRNLTIDELAQIIEITPSLLGLIERGQRGTTIKNLCKLADFFSISMDSMLNRDIEGLTEKDDVTPLDIKRERVKNLMDTLTEEEIEFVNVTLNLLNRLRKYDSDDC